MSLGTSAGAAWQAGLPRMWVSEEPSMLSHMWTRCSAREPTAVMSCMALVMIMTKAMQLIMKGTFNRAALLGVLADDRRAC